MSHTVVQEALAVEAIGCLHLGITTPEGGNRWSRAVSRWASMCASWVRMVVRRRRRAGHQAPQQPASQSMTHDGLRLAAPHPRPT